MSFNQKRWEYSFAPILLSFFFVVVVVVYTKSGSKAIKNADVGQMSHCCLLDLVEFKRN